LKIGNVSGEFLAFQKPAGKSVKVLLTLKSETASALPSEGSAPGASRR
jgi:hypothetical protein